MHTDFQKGTKRVKGEDVSHVVLCLPLGYPNMKEAIDKAIESIPGSIGLVDGVVKQSGWSCLFYGQNKYIVEGTPLFPTDYDYEEATLGRPEAFKNNAKHQSRTTTAAPVSAAVTPAPAPAAENTETYIFYHEAKDGETLASIAKQYGVSVGDIIKWNKLSESTIRRGQKLKLLIKD